MFNNKNYPQLFCGKLSHFLKNTRFHLLLLILTGIALYLNTLPFPFVFDDRVLIANNPLVKNSAGFFDLLDINNFLPEYLPKLNDSDMVTSFALRPIAYITFRLNYIFGGNSPAGYRGVNIAIHIANAIMLYQMLLNIIRLRVKDASINSYLTIPFFAAFLFLVHPLQTESVTYITQRFTSLGTFFYIATILLYLQSLLCKSVLARRLMYITSVLALLLGMYTKEFLFTAPISMVLIEYILLRNSLSSSFRRHIPHLACMIVIPLLLFVLSYDLTGKSFSIGSATAISNINSVSRIDYGITQIRVVMSYFRLLVLPYNLNFDPDYKLYKTLLNPEILLSIFVMALFLLVAIRLLRKKERTLTDDLVAFSIFWFPMLLVISSSVVPLPDLMSEHRTYLPSLAFCIGITAHLHNLQWRFLKRRSALSFAGAVAVLMVFCSATVMRNQVYSSRLSLWSDTAAKNPNKGRPALALGNVYQEIGQNELAIAWLTKSMQLDQDYIEPYLSLGSILSDLGRDAEAIGVYETYIERYQPDQRILSNLALAYTNVGMPEEALATLKTALSIDPEDEMLHLVTAELLYMWDRDLEASSYLDEAEELDGENPLVNYAPQIEMLKRAYVGDDIQIKSTYKGSVAS